MVAKYIIDMCVDVPYMVNVDNEDDKVFDEDNIKFVKESDFNSLIQKNDNYYLSAFDDNPKQTLSILNCIKNNLSNNIPDCHYAIAKIISDFLVYVEQYCNIKGVDENGNLLLEHSSMGAGESLLDTLKHLGIAYDNGTDIVIKSSSFNPNN